MSNLIELRNTTYHLNDKGMIFQKDFTSNAFSEVLVIKYDENDLPGLIYSKRVIGLHNLSKLDNLNRNPIVHQYDLTWLNGELQEFSDGKGDWWHRDICSYPNPNGSSAWMRWATPHHKLITYLSKNFKKYYEHKDILKLMLGYKHNVMDPVSFITKKEKWGK